MNRFTKVTHQLKLSEVGLEIGPSHSPIVAKKDGYPVHSMDHLNRAELIQKYAHHGVNLENIEEVDYVWHGQSFLELTEKPKHYHWIIASHVIEHTPDLIGFLKDCDSILRDDGVISLVIPDKRYCFDNCRPISSLGSVIDSHLIPRKNHSPGTVAEYFLNVVAKNGAIAWEAGTPGTISQLYTADHAIKQYQMALSSDAYIDIHRWCFVPHAFRLLIHDLFLMGLTKFKEVSFNKTEGCEFFISLSRAGQGPALTRLEMIERLNKELAAPQNYAATLLRQLTFKTKGHARKLLRKKK